MSGEDGLALALQLARLHHDILEVRQFAPTLSEREPAGNPECSRPPTSTSSATARRRSQAVTTSF